MSLFCSCLKYVFWYENDDGIRICECGHPQGDHVEDRSMCIGDVEIK